MPLQRISPEAVPGSNSVTSEPTKKWFCCLVNSSLTSTGWFWKAASYSFIDDPPHFGTVHWCPDFVVSNVTRTLAGWLRHRTRTRALGLLEEVLGPGQHTLGDKPNYRELRQSEVRRKSLPRTWVHNMISSENAPLRDFPPCRLSYGDPVAMG